MAKKTGGWFRESQRHALAAKGLPTGRKSRTNPKYKSSTRVSDAYNAQSKAESIIASAKFKGLWGSDEPMLEEEQLYIFDELVMKKYPELSETKAWEVTGLVYDMHNSSREIEDRREKLEAGFKDKPYQRGGSAG
jgi:hypothetical protein